MTKDQVSDLLKRAQRELNLGNPKEAMSYYNQVLALDDSNITALNKLGNIFGQLGKYESAIKCYNKVLTMKKNDLLALINKGLAFHYLKKYEDAIACYDLVLNIQPNSAVALYNKASSLVKIGKFNDALAFLEKAIKKDFSYKAKAKFDIDFQEIKVFDKFKKLVT